MRPPICIVEQTPVSLKGVGCTNSPIESTQSTHKRNTNSESCHHPEMNFRSGTELARPFVPAKDFGLSKRFYEALGFEKLLDGDVAIFGIGTSSFILQNRFEKDWAENFMMQLIVDDVDSWWGHIQELDLPARFGVPQPKAPSPQPWGLRVAFLVDPSRVLWHVAERRPGNASDSGHLAKSN